MVLAPRRQRVLIESNDFFRVTEQIGPGLDSSLKLVLGAAGTLKSVYFGELTNKLEAAKGQVPEIDDAGCPASWLDSGTGTRVNYRTVGCR